MDSDYSFLDAAALVAIYLLSACAGKSLFFDLDREYRCSCFSYLPICPVSNRVDPNFVPAAVAHLYFCVDGCIGDFISLHALLSEASKILLVLAYWLGV